MKVIFYSYLIFILGIPFLEAKEIFNSAKVLFVVGHVEKVVKHQHTVLMRGDILQDGDYVTTGKKSLALIRVVSKNKSVITTIKVTQKSKVKIRIMRKVPMAHLSIGGIVVQVLSKYRNDKSLKFKVQSRVAALGVRGTEFFVYAEDADKQMATVKEGVVEMVASADQKLLQLHHGLSTLTNRHQQLINPREYAWQKKINWELNPHHKDLFQPMQLWHDLHVTWEKYKQEQEFIFNKYKQQQLQQFKQWENDNEQQKQKIFET